MKIAMIVLFISSGIFLVSAIAVGCIVKIESCYEGKTLATVVSIRQISDEGNAMQTPVFEFQHKGKKYNVSNNIATKHSKYKVGDRVEIKYDINNPNRFAVSGSIALKVLMIIFFSIAAILFISGAVVFFLSLR